MIASDNSSLPSWIRFSSGLVFSMLVFIHCQAIGQNQMQEKDSVSGPSLVITPRFNSAGHFPFTGALVNNNLNFDLNILTEYKNFGFFLFKSIDLEDKPSNINYMQPGIYRNFQLTPVFQARVYFGYVFPQPSGFRIENSDIFTAASISCTVSDKLKLENTLLLIDLSQSEKLVNRLLISWKINIFKLDYFLWHRTVLPNGFHATSTSLAFNIPIKLSNEITLINTFSYQGFISKSKPEFARREGFLYSIAIPIAIKP